MKCDCCGRITISLWRSTDDDGNPLLVCGECVDAEIDLRHVRSTN